MEASSDGGQMPGLRINGEDVTVDADPDTPLLWVLRDGLDLTGTKYGCGLGLCGACTVHVDGKPARACSITLADVGGAEVTTIEWCKRQACRNRTSGLARNRRVPQRRPAGGRPWAAAAAGAWPRCSMT